MFISNPVIKSSRAPPVLPEDKGNVVSQEIPEVEESEEVEEQDLLDNLFFTFCCGDNLTCLKANMVRRIFIYIFSLIFPPQVCDGVLHCPDGEDESQCERKPEDSKEEHHVEKNDVLVALNSVSVLY